MYQKDYNVENEIESVKRSEYDDTLYVLKCFLNEFQNKENKILDLGCGDGNYHKYLNEFKIIGLDRKESNNENIFKQDLENFPYDSKIGPFDFIFSIDVFEHLQRPDLILKYLKQDHHILKENGFIFLSVPNINTLDDKLHNINQAVFNPKLKQYTSGR
jgi:2-polyprenyl-3-methyl-5-hydroxy-6-metoxy-1,4-benzoquinol methylase